MIFMYFYDSEGKVKLQLSWTSKSRATEPDLNWREQAEVINKYFSKEKNVHCLGAIFLESKFEIQWLWHSLYKAECVCTWVVNLWVCVKESEKFYT